MPRTAHWDRTPAAPRPAGSPAEPRREGNAAFCLSCLPAPGLGGDTEGVPLPTGFICSLLMGARGWDTGRASGREQGEWVHPMLGGETESLPPKAKGQGPEEPSQPKGQQLGAQSSPPGTAPGSEQ